MALTVIPEKPHPLAEGLRTGAQGFFQALTGQIEQQRLKQDLMTISERLKNGTIEEGLGELLTPQGAQMGLQMQLEQLLNPRQRAEVDLKKAQTENIQSGTRLAEDAAPGLQAERASRTAVNNARVTALKQELLTGVPRDSTEFERIMATPEGMALSSKDRIAAYRRQLGLDPKPASTKQMPERTLRLLNQAQESIAATREVFRLAALDPKTKEGKEPAAIKARRDTKGKSITDTLRGIKQRIFSLNPQAVGSMTDINEYFRTQGLSPEDEL